MRTTSRVTGETAAAHALAEMRWAGASLAVGAVLYMIAIILFATLYGHPEGTGPGGNVTLVDIAEHTRARWKLSQGLWSMEMAGALLIGLAALILQRGRRTGPSWLPTSVAWSTVAVGASTLTVMYAFTLGSYPPALAAIHEQTALFAALRGGVRSLFHVGMAAMFFGFTGAFIGETLAKDAVLPRWVALVGAAVTLLATVRWIAMFSGFIGRLSPPLGLAAFFLTGLLGLSIWKRVHQTNSQR